MKKIISVILLSLMIASCFALCINAEKQQLEIPKATKVPTLDGKIDKGEWDAALTVEMKKGDTSLFVAAGTLDTFGGATFRYFWNEQGIYFAAEVNDTTAPMTPPASGTGSYNSGDGIQFNIYTNSAKVGQDAGELLFFSYNPKLADGTFGVGEHFVFGTVNAGADVASAKIATEVKDDNSYVIEGLIPTEAFAKIKPSLAIMAGAKLYLNSVVMEMDEAGNQSLIVDNEWFDATKANEYTLLDAPKEETKAADDTVEAVDTAEADGTEAEDVTAPAETEADAQPVSAWLYIVIAAAVVVVAAAVVVVAKKSKKK